MNAKSAKGGPAPLFSVVVPVYNRLDPLHRALTSLREQTVSDWEGVVVDDGSLDGAGIEQVVRSFSDDRICYVRRPNGGASAARNTGIDAAAGRLVALLDSDDAFLPHKLERAARAFDGKEDTDLVFFSRLLVDRAVGKLWTKPPRGPHPGERIDEYLMCTFGWIQTSTIVLPTGLARRVRFDEGLRSSQDTDFAVRCASAGALFHFDPEPLTRLADVFDPTRVSKQNRVDPQLRWIETMRRTHVSERAYWAYRGWQCARIASFTNRPRGIGLFLDAAVRGVYSPRMAARIASQVLIPQTLYQRIATGVVALAGRS